MNEKEEGDLDLTITVVPDKGALRLTVAGELDLYSAPEMQHALDTVYQSAYEALILDLRRLEFIDSAGLALLIDVRCRLGKDRALTLLVSAEGQANQVLHLSGFHRFFQIEFAHEDTCAEQQPPP